MPLFEYECARCGEDFELLVKNADASESVSCPACSDNDVVKKFSAFATAISAKDSLAAPAPVPSAPCGPACGCHH
ncbi:MAG: zinc ribbon domain-containing protein [Gemmatimonadetes bacterium]|nr:zinc ribbon domain-containing protein [Gemmatimonadota bacterium]